jgi:L-arabinose isomerase
MSVRVGPVTLLSVVECKRREFKLLVAEGRTKKARFFASETPIAVTGFQSVHELLLKSGMATRLPIIVR